MDIIKERQMKDFQYYNPDGPTPPNRKWLRKIGLRETQWILDANWFIRYHPKSIYKEWVDG